jgi:formate dehydrogenase
MNNEYQSKINSEMVLITARGKIVDTLSLLEALEKGHLAGYAGDVWYHVLMSPIMSC